VGSYTRCWRWEIELSSPPPKLNSIRRVADRTDLSVATFWGLTAAGKLDVVRNGRRNLVREEELDRFVRTLR
jgi:hypothetical protein